MTYLSPADETVSSASWRGIVFEVYKGRIYIDDSMEDSNQAITELFSHGFTVSENQEDDIIEAGEEDKPARRKLTKPT